MYVSRLVLFTSRKCLTSKSVLITFCPIHGTNQVNHHSSSSKILASSAASHPQPNEPRTESKLTTNNQKLGIRLNEAINFNPVVHRPHFESSPLIEIVTKIKPNQTPEKHHLLYNHQEVNSESDTIKLLNSELLNWKQVSTLTPANLVKYWLRLAKFRLTSLVVMTTMACYWMAAGTIDPMLLTATLVGTGLTSSSAASLNQFLEIPFDSQMVRTRNRPLVLGQISPKHAVGFSVVTGVAGLATLATFVNPITTALGAMNLVLYSAIYTPMKRSNIANIWVGSVVGAIPPVMGFTAATGTLAPGAFLVGAILYSWQFPHFNALSWNLRHDYARAGYRMMSVTEPGLCLRTALRHSVALTAMCVAACYPPFDMCTLWFALDTLPFNAYLIYLSYKFYSDPSAATSRNLFRYSLIYLPAIILCMIMAKNTASTTESGLTPLETSMAIS